MDDVVFVSKNQFDLMYDLYSGDILCEEKPVVDTIFIQNNDYMISGLVMSGIEGIKYYFGCKAIPVSVYKGDLEPMFYKKHSAAVSAGKRKRGYVGMKFKCKGRVLVVIETVRFKPNHEVKQLQLF